jgi:signal transduction histidine kinase
MSSNLSFEAKILAKLLQHRLGKVRAIERALRLQGVTRFILIALVSIIAPAVVLAYFGISSTKDLERDSITEMQTLSQNVALSFVQEVNTEIIGFEDIINSILSSGHTPVRNFYKNQRISLRFDKDQQLISPFVEQNETHGADVFFHPAYNQNSNRSQQKMDGRTRDNILYKKLQKLSASKNTAETNAILKTLLTSKYRHINGPKLKHLAQFEKLKLTPVSFTEFRTIMELILSDPWTIGEGVDAVLAQQILDVFMESSDNLATEEKAYLENTRLRIREQFEALFWASEWEEEWREIIAQPRQTQPGRLYWQVGEKGIWARTTWGDEIYIFGLDKKQMVERLETMARTNTRYDALVSTQLLTPNSSVPKKMITRRYIPWLEGWSVAVVEQDLSSLKRQENLRRRQQTALIGFAILTMGVGAVLSIKLALQELNVATIKSNFAASVSHELRSPITQIRLKGESLMFGLAETDEELVEHYEAIVRESERLSWLVDNVLDYAALERDSKQFVIRPANLNETIQRVVDGMKVTLTMREVDISVTSLGGTLTIKHDPDAISQCISNLLSNAEKYSREDKWIGVMIRKTETFIEVVVSDKGIGISPDDANDIFEPFFRSKEKEALRRKGTGIGLSITRSIMQAHGGKVIVRSQLGQGSTFILLFPIELLVLEGENHA